MRLPIRSLAACALLVVGAWGMTAEWKSGINWTEPRLVDTSDPVPSDAKVLFRRPEHGRLERRQELEDRKRLRPGRQHRSHQRAFRDVQLHLEFATPEKVEGTGQGRGNSGVYFMDRYEVQILDSYNNTTYFDGQCASIYKQRPPLVNACRKPGEWQTYDIVFHAPGFELTAR